MNLGLQGKVAIVTGGARGLGEDFVRGFLNEGAHVVIADILSDEMQQAASRLSSSVTKVIGLRTDVSRKLDAENTVKRAITQFGRIDILVNAAGVIGDLEFWDIEEGEWDRVMNINAKGTYLVTKFVVPHMMSRRYGKIVNISSRAGKQGVATMAHYSASKFAVIGLTQSLARALAPYNINVNAICPGIIRTYLWEVILENRTERTGRPRDEIFREIVETTIPLGRPLEPEDVTNMVLYLSSDVARNITGETVNVNGGSFMD